MMPCFARPISPSTLFVAALTVGAAPLAFAQGSAQGGDAVAVALPEAQAAAASARGSSLPDAPAPARVVHVGRFNTLIEPDEAAPHLTQWDKVGMGMKSAVSLFAVAGWLTSATYSEAFDRSPNYGQSGSAYLQRFGAAAAKASSESIFTVSVLSPLLREDPRYYALGPGHPKFQRTTHALAKIFVTRTDSGMSSINFALLGGNLAGSALTQAYFPERNRGASEVGKTFGTSLAGSAVKYIFQEFFSQTVTDFRAHHPL